MTHRNVASEDSDQTAHAQKYVAELSALTLLLSAFLFNKLSIEKKFICKAERLTVKT